MSQSKEFITDCTTLVTKKTGNTTNQNQTIPMSKLKSWSMTVLSKKSRTRPLHDARDLHAGKVVRKDP